MKKTLVALAALAATASFAQSSVTLSGNLDFAYSSSTGSATIYSGNTIATTTGTASTSVINIRAVEDIGGGMKVTAHYGLDPRTLANDGFGVTNTTTSTAPAVGLGNTATGLGRDELFVAISGGFGEIRVGAPNSISLNTFQASSPMGTGIGSGYAALTVANGNTTTRYNRSVRFDSPVMNGFSVSALHAPGGDSIPTNATANTAIASNTTTLGEPNARKATELSLNYSNGPLNVRLASVNIAAQDNGLGYYSAATTYKTATTSMIGANYTFGATTLYAGYVTGDQYAGATGTNTTNATVKQSRLAVKQNFGAVDVIVQTQNSVVTTAGVDGATVSVVGARVDYNLSKTAVAYLGYQRLDNGSAYVATTYAGGDLSTVSVGLRKSF
jgi:predicted porin